MSSNLTALTTIIGEFDATNIVPLPWVEMCNIAVIDAT